MTQSDESDWDRFNMQVTQLKQCIHLLFKTRHIGANRA